jgi:hypothetical protein
LNLAGWVSEDTPFWTRRPRTDDDWHAVAAEYGDDAQLLGPLRRCLQVARDGGCRTIVVENRYVDADYRSEFSAFWSLKFAGRPGFTRRMHFLAAEIDDNDVYKLPADVGYLGYVVLRPVPTGVVGRTVLAPPLDLLDRGATLVTVTETVSLFGADLTLEGVPFCTQDGEFIRCAHAATWICHYGSYRRGLTGRYVTARLVEYSPTMLSYDRPLPSTGMNYQQMQAVFSGTGQPALMYVLGDLPTVQGVADPTPVPDSPAGAWDTRLFSVICRYLNSGFPVLVGTRDHAFVVVGYYEEVVEDEKLIRFVACDDQVGPYEVIDNPLVDTRGGPWEAVMIPLPPRVFLPGEAAENDAYETLIAFKSAKSVPDRWIELSTELEAKELSLRTMLVSNREYKKRLPDQGRPDEVVRALRLAPLSNWVWVVEAHDRSARETGKPCAVAEFVYDSTSFEYPEPRRLAVSYPGITVTLPPDKGKERVAAGAFDAWKSQFLN